MHTLIFACTGRINFCRIFSPGEMSHHLVDNGASGRVLCVTFALTLLTRLFVSVGGKDYLVIYPPENTEHAVQPSRFFRVEVLFTHLENIDGRTYNGKRCDIVTKCDPIVYTFIDMEIPQAPFPGAARSLKDFNRIVQERDKNTVIMNAKLTQDLCTPVTLKQQKPINVRVKVMDYDFLTLYDLIEEFDCRLPGFKPRNASVVIEKESLEWSSVTDCVALNRPGKVKLSYRWRAYPIMASDCGAVYAPLPGRVVSRSTPPSVDS
ncbi:hypothetical protein RvY_16376 [Ramazzottius varieornatus]|uniref:Uncharacterized protein n=1 Tax=Ramazzottius varieornatus TaxID=947166 RepID=A0A1D1VY68_RAMVA|nr:hypothetical protein RvY_16376 [Ramazzottius varieornatus]